MIKQNDKAQESGVITKIIVCFADGKGGVDDTSSIFQELVVPSNDCPRYRSVRRKASHSDKRFHP